MPCALVVVFVGAIGSIAQYREEMNVSYEDDAVAKTAGKTLGL